MSFFTSYDWGIKKFPPKGERHPYLKGLANRAIQCHISEQQYYADVKSLAPDMTDKEILQAYRKSQKEGGVNPKASEWRPAENKVGSMSASVLANRLIEKFRGLGESELMDASKVKLVWEPGLRDVEVLLSNLYKPDEFLYIGEPYGTEVRTVKDWIACGYANKFPHIAPNPMTGQPAPSTGGDGKMTMRGDNCVAKHLFAVAEMDGHSKEHQIALCFGLMSVGFEIAAIIDSGGKSIHAWVAVNCCNADKWTQVVECGLFDRYLVPMGVDRACKNEARLSRLPGHFRSEKGNYQRLLYLNPGARKIW